MTWAANTRVIENGPRDLIIEFVGYDSAPVANTVVENGVTKVGQSTYNLTLSHTKVRRILASVTNCVVQIVWDGATPTNLAVLGGNTIGDYNLDPARAGTQGIWNDATTPTGNILFTTTEQQVATSVGPAGYTITLFMVKGQ